MKVVKDKKPKVPPSSKDRTHVSRVLGPWKRRVFGRPDLPRSHHRQVSVFTDGTYRYYFSIGSSVSPYELRQVAQPAFGGSRSTLY